MNLSKNLKLLLHYSRDYLFLSILISLVTLFVIANTTFNLLTGFIWFKVAVSAITIMVHRKRKEKEIFFYMNNGLGERDVLLFAFLTDLGIWVLGLTLIIKWTI